MLEFVRAHYWSSCDPASSLVLSPKAMLGSYLPEWNAYVSKWHALQQADPDRVFVISYERWLQHPAKVLAALGTKLNQTNESAVCSCLLRLFNFPSAMNQLQVPQSEQSFAEARQKYLSCGFLSWYDGSAIEFLLAAQNQTLLTWLDAPLPCSSIQT